MINGLWQGKVLDADEVAKTEEFETKIRIAGANNELKCTDPECNSAIQYKHGQLKRPHFAHKSKSACAYAEFEKQDNSTKKKVRSALYNHFVSLGYDVKREVRIPNGRKYCDLLLNIRNQNFVIRISSSSSKAKDVKEFTEECERNNCKLLWISIGDPYITHHEKHHYHAMRYQFNHTTNKNLLIINSDATIVAQIKEDDLQYEYKGCSLNSRYFSEDIHNFKIIRDVSELRIIDGELTIDGFVDEYDAWNERKQTAFEKMKADIDSYENRISAARQITEAYNKSSQDQQFGAYHRNVWRNNSVPSADSESDTASTDISGYCVGAKVLHTEYGYGQIVELSNKSNSQNHLIKVRYFDGYTYSHELEVLIKVKKISIAN